MGLVRRAASLASVPVSTSARFASAAAIAALGSDRDEAYARATAASVESLTSSLARARGPALKFGQALAVFSSALPSDQAAQMSALSRLFENAQPQPFSAVRKQLRSLPKGVEVSEVACAAASLGQVHRGTWVDGSDVAVKVRYSDAPRVVKADMLQLRTLAPLVARLLPTLDVRALIDEHAERLSEELDYTHEASWQKKFRRAWKPEGIVVPKVLFASEQVIVSRWVDGVAFSQLGAEPAFKRDLAGRQLARFCFWSPRLVGATHADPHPGNFRLLDDGRLAVLDFGSVASGSGLFTRLFAQTLALSSEGQFDEVLRLWGAAGLVSDTTTPADLEKLIDADDRLYVRDEFTFSREWLSSRSDQFQDPSRALRGASKLRFPPSYLLEHRAVMGTIALLCGIDATVDFRAVLDGVLDPARS